jgi:hypothetical protein
VSRVGLEENAVVGYVHHLALRAVEEALREREGGGETLGAVAVIEVLECVFGQVLPEKSLRGVAVVLDVPGLRIGQVVTKVGGPAEPVASLPVGEAVEAVAQLLHGLERRPALKEELGILRGEVNVRVLGLGV